MARINLENYELFKKRILEDAKWMLGVNKDSNVEHHLALLVQAIDRVIFNGVNPVDNAKDTNSKVKKFIAIFEKTYEKACGTPYRITHNAKEIRIIEFAIEKVESANGTIEEFIEWFFNDFLIRKKDWGTTVSSIAQNFIIQEYFKDNASRLERRKSDQVAQIEKADIYNRWRALIRKHGQNPTMMKQLVDLQKQFNEDNTAGNLNLKVWKEVLIKMEEHAQVAAG